MARILSSWVGLPVVVFRQGVVDCVLPFLDGEAATDAGYPVLFWANGVATLHAARWTNPQLLATLSERELDPENPPSVDAPQTPARPDHDLGRALAAHGHAKAADLSPAGAMAHQDIKTPSRTDKINPSKNSRDIWTTAEYQAFLSRAHKCLIRNTKKVGTIVETKIVFSPSLMLREWDSLIASQLSSGEKQFPKRTTESFAKKWGSFKLARCMDSIRQEVEEREAEMDPKDVPDYTNLMKRGRDEEGDDTAAAKPARTS